MLQCERCPREAEVAVIPLVGDVSPADVVLVHTIAYTCTTCAAELISLGHMPEMSLEDHDAVFYPEKAFIGTEGGWLKSDAIVDAAHHR